MSTLFSKDLIDHYRSGTLSLKGGKEILSGDILDLNSIIENLDEDRLIITNYKSESSIIIDRDGKILKSFKNKGRYFTSSDEYHIFGDGGSGEDLFL